VMTLFAAGLETTANALTFTWYLLSRHPEAERAVREEAAGLDTGRPGLEDLRAACRTPRWCSRTMRLYPPAWMLARRCVEPVPLGPYEVPEGALIMMPPYLLHRDERFWPDPERFSPERWAEGGGAPAHRYAYLPFGAGTRKCIGATFATVEGALLLATIARRVRLEAVGDDPLELVPQITLRPRGGLPMRVRTG